jgi:hypothetical protein
MDGIFDPPESPASDPLLTSIDVARLDDAMNVVERRPDQRRVSAPLAIGSSDPAAWQPLP